MVCRRPKGDTYQIQDDEWVMDFYFARKDADAASLVHDVLASKEMWDEDLTRIPGLESQVLEGVSLVREKGAEAAFRSCLKA